MSSCFLCDCSYEFTGNDKYDIFYAESKKDWRYMKYMPIMVGSSGLEINRQDRVVGLGTDQQHTNDKTQNYVSYRVKKIEFRASVNERVILQYDPLIPDYIIIFKVPFRVPVFDYYFTVMKNFMLYSEPESVLKYGVYSYSLTYKTVAGHGVTDRQMRPDKYNLTVDKPFVVGPNDYVGVLYFFSTIVNVNASARVWFDIV